MKDPALNLQFSVIGLQDYEVDRLIFKHEVTGFGQAIDH